jgi:hypothetical protein
MSVSMSLAGYSDGYITAGEYEGHVSWASNTQPLIVDGGGAIGLEMRNYSRLEVRSTSTPLGLGSGIQVIGLKDNSHLDYYDGETFNLMLQFNATADLYGGRIDYISSYQLAATKHINIYALPGWSWISDDPMEGIQGQWWDGSPFDIKFDNKEYWPIKADPVWMNVNVIVPEPTTLLLLTLGCVVILKKKPRIRLISRNLINSSSRAFYRVTMKASVMFLVFSSAVSFAGYSDGWITAEEYEGTVRWTSNTQPLIVDGGGAMNIEMWNYSQLEVRSTSTPLGLGSGIQYIGLKDNSHLDYFDGETFNLMLYDNTTANLYGGRIDYLTSFQYTASTRVNIYALPGWSWISDDPLEGIQGQWWDGSPFRIEFTDENERYHDVDPVWMNINVIIPEPASLFLIAIGIALIRKR